MCNKKTYIFESEANKSANRINSNNKKNGSIKRLRSYKCRECDNYHLTSMPKGIYSINRKYFK